MTAAALLVLALALVLPWTTAYQHGGLGGAEAVSETPRLLFVVASQALVGLWVASRDRWLGILVVYVALNALRAPLGALPLVVSGYVTFGALVIVAARGLPRFFDLGSWRVRIPIKWSVFIYYRLRFYRWQDWAVPIPYVINTHQRARDLFVVAALVQIAYAADQYFGCDVLWNAAAAPYRIDRQIPGTIGHGNWLGVFLAMVGPLAPAAALPVFVGGLWLAQSRLGLVALALGLLVQRGPDLVRRWRCRGEIPWPAWLHNGLALMLLVATAWTLLMLAWLMPKSMSNITARFVAAGLGFDIWHLTGGYSGVLLGLGPGTWSVYIPSAQLTFGILPGVPFTPAHNEPMQLVFEHGLVGLLLVGGLLWSYRRALQGPYAGALAALAVTTLGMFPFHLAQLAVPALVLVGLATTDHRAGKE